MRIKSSTFRVRTGIARVNLDFSIESHGRIANFIGLERSGALAAETDGRTIGLQLKRRPRNPLHRGIWVS